ncbi:MAG: branched-chain amino acid ABC transporter permease [Chthonomonadales bacterium]|nr:branched-chain amino acid ABC transporter permease [Chthonomonadales bacterium]
MQSFLQQAVFGIQLGSLYALIAIGYTLVYGVLRLINFAHGDVFMVGAFVCYYACTRWLPFRDLSADPAGATTNIALAVVVLIITMAVCALLGVLIERFAYRPLRNGLRIADAHFWGLVAALPVAVRLGPFSHPGVLLAWLVIGVAFGYALRPVVAWIARRSVRATSRLNALITAIGVSFVLEYGGLLVVGADPNFVPTIVPERVYVLPGGVRVGTPQLAILAISLVLMLVLRYIVTYTRRGKAMRAIAHDIEAAKLMGIDTDRVISFTFALGGALAGAGGALVAALTHVKITPLFGLLPGIKAFVAAVLGGPGSIPGAVLGGLLMGLAEAFVAGSKASAFRDAIAFCILIVLLLVRPSGLLGRHVAEKV